MKIESKVNDEGKLVFGQAVVLAEQVSPVETKFDDFAKLREHLEARIKSLEGKLNAASSAYLDLMRAFDANGRAMPVPDFIPFKADDIRKQVDENAVRLVLDMDFDEADRMSLVGARVKVPGLTEQGGEICQDPRQLGLLFRTIKRAEIAKRIDNFLENQMPEQDFSKAAEYADDRTKKAGPDEKRHFIETVAKLEKEYPERAAKLKAQRQLAADGKGMITRSAWPSYKDMLDGAKEALKEQMGETDGLFPAPDVGEVAGVFGMGPEDVPPMERDARIAAMNERAQKANQRRKEIPAPIDLGPRLDREEALKDAKFEYDNEKLIAEWGLDLIDKQVAKMAAKSFVKTQQELLVATKSPDKRGRSTKNRATGKRKAAKLVGDTAAAVIATAIAGVITDAVSVAAQTETQPEQVVQTV